MQSNSQSNVGPRLAAFVLAALATACAAYWVLKWPAPGTGVDTSSVSANSSAPVDPLALARALGGGTAAAPTAVDVAPSGLGSRLALAGVVADSRRAGAALISVDGKPARPYRVGARIENELVLLSVGPRSAALAPDANGPASVTLEMPPLRK